MAKKYLAFQDDLTKIKNNDLVIKEGSFRSLVDVELGTSIYIPENVSGVLTEVEYIVVEKYRATSSNPYVITILRKDLLSSSRSYGEKGHYSGLYTSQLGRWLNGDYLNNFSDGIKANFCEKTIITTKYNPSSPRYTDITEDLKVFIPSFKELGLNYTDGYSDWTPYIDKVAKASGTAQYYWTRYPASGDAHYLVSSAGVVGGSSYSTHTSSSYVRPAIALYENAKIDNDNVLQPYERTYSGAVDSIQEGNTYYKVKDIDGRDSSNLSYDNTISGMSAITVKGAIDELATKIDGVDTLLGTGVIT